MKRLRKQHVLEQSIYGAIWIVIFLLPLIGGYFAMSGGLEREETRMVIRESWLSILPFFVRFLLPIIPPKISSEESCLFV